MIKTIFIILNVIYCVNKTKIVEVSVLNEVGENFDKIKENLKNSFKKKNINDIVIIKKKEYLNNKGFINKIIFKTKNIDNSLIKNKNLLNEKNLINNKSNFKNGKILLNENNNNKNEANPEEKLINNRNNSSDVNIDYNIKFIPLKSELIWIVFNNLDKISKNKIINVSIYKKDDKYIDFWGKLEFINKNGLFFDKSNVFEGVLKENFKNLIETSKMSKIGLFVDKNTNEVIEEKNIKNLKQLILEISNKKNISLENLLKTKYDKNTIDEIIMYNNYPLKEEDIVYACICKNKECLTCEEVRKVERKNLQEIN